MTTKDQIEFSEFLEIEKKLDIRIGQVLDAERVPKSNKLLKLTVNFNFPDEELKTVVTNLGGEFEPEHFEGYKFPFIVNLKPSKMMGIVSEAMIMVAKNQDIIELDDFSAGSILL